MASSGERPQKQAASQLPTSVGQSQVARDAAAALVRRRSSLMKGNSVVLLNQIYAHHNSVPARNRILASAKSLQQSSNDLTEVAMPQPANLEPSISECLLAQVESNCDRTPRVAQVAAGKQQSAVLLHAPQARQQQKQQVLVINVNRRRAKSRRDAALCSSSSSSMSPPVSPTVIAKHSPQLQRHMTLAAPVSPTLSPTHTSPNSQSRHSPITTSLAPQRHQDIDWLALQHAPLNQQQPTMQPLAGSSAVQRHRKLPEIPAAKPQAHFGRYNTCVQASSSCTAPQLRVQSFPMPSSNAHVGEPQFVGAHSSPPTSNLQALQGARQSQGQIQHATAPQVSPPMQVLSRTQMSPNNSTAAEQFVPIARRADASLTSNGLPMDASPRSSAFIFERPQATSRQVSPKSSYSQVSDGIASSVQPQLIASCSAFTRHAPNLSMSVLASGEMLSVQTSASNRRLSNCGLGLRANFLLNKQRAINAQNSSSTSDSLTSSESSLETSADKRMTRKVRRRRRSSTVDVLMKPRCHPAKPEPQQASIRVSPTARLVTASKQLNNSPVKVAQKTASSLAATFGKLIGKQSQPLARAASACDNTPATGHGQQQASGGQLRAVLSAEPSHNALGFDDRSDRLFVEQLQPALSNARSLDGSSANTSRPLPSSDGLISNTAGRSTSSDKSVGQPLKQASRDSTTQHKFGAWIKHIAGDVAHADVMPDATSPPQNRAVVKVRRRASDSSSSSSSYMSNEDKSRGSANKLLLPPSPQRRESRVQAIWSAVLRSASVKPAADKQSGESRAQIASSDHLTLDDKVRLAEKSAAELFCKVAISASSLQQQASSASAQERTNSQLSPSAATNWQTARRAKSEDAPIGKPAAAGDDTSDELSLFLRDIEKHAASLRQQQQLAGAMHCKRESLKQNSEPLAKCGPKSGQSKLMRRAKTLRTMLRSFARGSSANAKSDAGAHNSSVRLGEEPSDDCDRFANLVSAATSESSAARKDSVATVKRKTAQFFQRRAKSAALASFTTTTTAASKS